MIQYGMNTPLLPRLFILAGLCIALVSCNQSDGQKPAEASTQSSPNQDKQTEDPPTVSPPRKSPEQLKERLELQRINAMSSSIQYKLMPQLAKLQSNTIPRTHQQILYTILANTNEVAIHQMRGESENRVYLNSDGREAVYDKNGDLVENGYNDGSYNYALGKDEPLLHFILDISPWILWGMSETDPTSIDERIYAYMADLEGGINRANAMLPLEPLPQDHTWPEISQIQALAIFVKAIELGEAEELFTLFEVGHEITDEEIVRVLTKLNTGFDQVYSIPDP